MSQNVKRSQATSLSSTGLRYTFTLFLGYKRAFRRRSPAPSSTPLFNRLTGAAYSSGESFEYRYDAVSNITAMTETTSRDETSVTTYTYDAANRLTSAGDVTYTWDGRGNLINDGVFTYTYNAAWRVVRAESLTVTLIFTYIADGLRVVQSVGESVPSVDTFAEVDSYSTTPT
ncbi:MAG: hypothetical protein SXV54_24610 [Chloroflexota bacterium]|nr:hypothetical protein [Chloroflexota bacterium]